MSLINDALKKAQKQRADDATTAGPPAVPPAPNVPRAVSPATAATRPPPVKLHEQPLPVARPVAASSIKYQATRQKEPVSPKTLWLCLGGIALVLVSVGITMRFMTPAAGPVIVAKSVPFPPAPKPSGPPPSDVAPPAPIPVVPPIAQPAPIVAVPVEVVAAPTPTSAPVVTLPAVQSAQPKPTPPPPAPTVVTETTVASIPAAAATPAPPASALPPLYAPRAPTPINPSVRIQGFIDRIRVTGIRKSDTESRVILNYRMFRVGDMVDSGLEVKLIKIEDGVLTFADHDGKIYIKLFQ